MVVQAGLRWIMTMLALVWGWLSRPFRPSHIVLNTARSENENSAAQHDLITGQSHATASDSSAFVDRLCRAAAGALSSYVQDNNLVHYDQVAHSSAFSAWKDVAAQLPHLDVGSLSHSETLALFINAYNMATIHAIISLGGNSCASVLSVPKFWKTYGYTIGQHFYSLDDMEHGILRCDRPHPSSKKQSFWPASDPRLAFLPQHFDHRIHFALVCGAKSCPCLRAVHAETLNADLTSLARHFVQTAVTVKGGKSDSNVYVTLSMILKWYRSDFGSNTTELLRTIQPHMTQEQSALIDPVITEPLASKPKLHVSHMKYDWSLNSAA